MAATKWQHRKKKFAGRRTHLTGSRQEAAAPNPADAKADGTESAPGAPSSKRGISLSSTCPIQYSTGLVGASGDTARAHGRLATWAGCSSRRGLRSGTQAEASTQAKANMWGSDVEPQHGTAAIAGCKIALQRAK